MNLTFLPVVLSAAYFLLTPIQVNAHECGGFYESTTIKEIQDCMNYVEPTNPTEPNTDPVDTTNPTSNACLGYGSTLPSAKSDYAANCPTVPRKDCDPIGSQWVCSSTTILNGVITQGSNTPNTNTGTSSASLRVEAESVNLTYGWLDNGGSIEWITPNEERYQLSQRKDESNLVYNINIPVAGTYQLGGRMRTATIFNPDEPGNDIWFLHPQTGWLKVWFTRDGNWQTTLKGEVGGVSSTSLLNMTLPEGNYALTISGRSRGTEIDYLEVIPQGFSVPDSSNSGDDLLVLNYDSYPDPDDMQAVLMGKLIVDKLGLDPVVVVGAHGEDNITTGGFVSGSVAHWRSIYPDTLDAYNDRQGAVNVLSVKILNHLQNGLKVSIAEAGPSDFTAQVLARVIEMDSSVNLKNVSVYQHSVAWNEVKTLDYNLSFVKSRTNYITLDDGNKPNSTANFQTSSSSAQCVRHMDNMINNTSYSSQWVDALSRLPDTRKCDGSDTVELLAIVGDTTTKTFDDFWDKYKP